MERDKTTGETPGGIEVTPEMVEAGVMVYWDSDRRIEMMEEIVARIFVAMQRIKEKAAGASPPPKTVRDALASRSI